jgi:hypothetical protein
VAPFFGGVMPDKNSQRENFLAVGRNHIHVFGSVNTVPSDLANFVKVILVDVTRRRRITFHAPHRLGASHITIILPALSDVNGAMSTGVGFYFEPAKYGRGLYLEPTK